MDYYPRSFSIVILIMISFQIQAQDNDAIYIRRNEEGTIDHARFKMNRSTDRKIENDTIFLKKVLNAKREDSFRMIQFHDDTATGYVHRTYQQYFKGLVVEAHQYLVHCKNGFIEIINGDFQIVDIADIIPKLTEQQCLRKALEYINASKYKWEDESFENSVDRNNDQNEVHYPKGELLIAKDLLTGSNSFKLCWKFSIFPLEPFNKRAIYIDAKNGDIINDAPLIDYSNITIYANTKYSNYQNITGDIANGLYRLQETRNGVNISTKNLNYQGDIENAIDFTNNGWYWTDNGTWSSYDDDAYALDAHFAAEKSFDFFKNNFNRNSINNAGMDIRSYTHFFLNFGNAGWDPDENCIKIGDGFGYTLPFTSIDTYAHEFAHGINQYEANLGSYYHYSESEALNEGFSDIWGACIEYSAAPSKSTWKHGEEVFTTSAYSCLRNLQFPNDPDAYEHGGPHPDTYQGDYWDFDEEPHQNSTVLSHWFYLLSKGGSGTNDNDDAYLVHSLGINIAQKIAYELENDHLASTSNYEDARDESIDAVNELFPNSTMELMQVTNAWYAVGLVDTPPTQMNIVGNTFVCPGGTTYTIDNFIQGCTVSWSSSSNISFSSTQDQETIIAYHNSSGTGWVKATVISPYSNSLIIEKTVTLETNPNLYYILPEYGNYYGYEGNSYSFHVWPESYSNYTFSIYPPYAYINWVQGALVNIYFPYPDIPFTISAYANDGTCTSNTVYMQFYVYGMYYSISPNPASSEVTITVVEDKTINSIDLSKTDLLYDVSIYDLYGNLKIRKKFSGEKFSIPIQNLKNGEYLVRINNGRATTSKQLIIKH
jgi:bacillolysin